MKAVESEGSTVDQAVERALILLDLPRERVEVQVLQEPSGAGNAIVRVTPLGQKPVSRETKDAPTGQGKATPPPLAMSDLSDGGDEGEQVRLLVSELLGHMGLSCRVSLPIVEPDGLRRKINLEGDDAGIVIGRQGQTLDALELVVNRIVDRRWPGSMQITMDAEGYRNRRAKKLVDIALEEAEEVRRSGQGVDLEPMSPRDRRSIHMALQGQHGVTTHSEGEGPNRHIVIEPVGPLGLSNSRSRSR